MLQFVTGKYAGESFPLPARERVIVGRSTEADIVLGDDAVSRKHALFYGARGRIWLRDLGSRNGTVVNGRPVERHCLRDGDRIAIGSSLLRVAPAGDPSSSGTFRGEKKLRAEERSPDSSGRSMTGSIQDIPLVDVLQWLATSRKTGTLNVRYPGGGRAGSLSLRQGQVFFARIDASPGLSAQKALLRMLRWTEGMFALDSNAPVEVTDDEIEAPLEHLLMEAARQQDELDNLASKYALPALTAGVELVRPSPVRWRELEPVEIDVVQELAEGRTWAQVLDFAAHDEVALTAAVARLGKRGLVRW
jgi:hypothetical protein